MDEAKVATWFLNIFHGNWVAYPEGETMPAPVLEDSRQWAGLFLAGHANPYQDARLVSQELLLGLGTSPDKLITTAEDNRSSTPITIYETLQDFVITRQDTSIPEPAGDRHWSLLRIQSDLLPLLSAEAATVVKKVVDNSLALEMPMVTEMDALVLLSVSSVSLNALTNWFDRVNLIRLGDGLYIQLYKTFPGSAAGPIKPGLNWHSQAVRARNGIER